MAFDILECAIRKFNYVETEACTHIYFAMLTPSEALALAKEIGQSKFLNGTTRFYRNKERGISNPQEVFIYASQAFEDLCYYYIERNAMRVRRWRS